LSDKNNEMIDLRTLLRKKDNKCYKAVANIDGKEHDYYLMAKDSVEAKAMSIPYFKLIGEAKTITAQIL